MFNYCSTEGCTRIGASLNETMGKCWETDSAAPVLLCGLMEQNRYGLREYQMRVEEEVISSYLSLKHFLL